MRHGKKFNHLGRKKAHREAMLSNMASSLLTHKRIFTTTAKAKALRVYVEPLITKGKDNTTHSRRVVFSYLQSKDVVNELFTTIGPKVADRPGGYTRILKTGNRLGDNADMCMMELVDFNESMLEAKASSAKAKSGSKRTRRGSKGTDAAPAAKAAPEKEVKEVAEEAAEVVAETAAPATGDDLTKIEGIGPKMAEVFTEAGLASFQALSEKTAEELKAILDAAEGNFAAHDPGTWPEQAKMAAEGKWDDLKVWQDELDGGK
jgi:large subunit ribosomal protein L17